MKNEEGRMKDSSRLPVAGYRLLIFALLTAALGGIRFGCASAQALSVEPTGTAETITEETHSEGNGEDVLCLPGVYLIDPDSCNPLGPSEYLTDYVKDGGVYPEPPFTGKKIDPALMEVPYQYARINVDNWEVINLYNSPEDAANSVNPVGTISSGAIRYVSYTDVVDIGSGHYVHSNPYPSPVARAHRW